MEKIEEAKAEYFFSRQGWLHVMELCEDLGRALEQAGLNDLVERCRSIYQWAIKSEDAIDGGGMLFAVTEDPSKMVSLLSTAAAQGDAEAQSILSDIYAQGHEGMGT